MAKNKLFRIFLLSLLIGYIFEFIINATGIWGYDDLTYLLGVPVFIVFVWGFLLTLGFTIVKNVEEKRKLTLMIALLLVFVPAIIIIETIGSQFLGIVINEDFPSLFPLTGCCKAPLGIYIIYYFVALISFTVFKDL